MHDLKNLQFGFGSPFSYEQFCAAVMRFSFGSKLHKTLQRFSAVHAVYAGQGLNDERHCDECHYDESVMPKACFTAVMTNGIL